MSDRVLERFHRALIEEIQTQRPEYLTAPFTVAEIYQNLVPYGSHRDRIGIEMNGDYEDALIRLLAGEGGYLILDSGPALEQLRAELEETNPDTGLYREFAAVEVRLNQAYLDLAATALDELPDLVEELDASDGVGMADLAPAERHGAGHPMKIVPPGVDIFTGESDPEDGSDAHDGRDLPASEGQEPSSAGRPPLAPEYVEAPGSNGDEVGQPAIDGVCVWCRSRLPDRENLNFCPFCGTDRTLIPCASCGEEVESDWLYCGMCGTEVVR